MRLFGLVLMGQGGKIYRFSGTDRLNGLVIMGGQGAVYWL